MSKTIKLSVIILIVVFTLSAYICASGQIAVSDIVSVNVDDLLDIELLYYDVDESYTISLNADFSKEEMSAFWREFNALPVYYENDISIPEGCSLEINLFYVTLDAHTIYDSNISGINVSASNESYYVRIDDVMDILEALGLEWEENKIGNDPTERPYLKYDIDKSGLIDVNDAILLLQHSMFPELYPLDYAGNADFTGDGVIDMNDAILLLQHSMFPELYPIE